MKTLQEKYKTEIEQQLFEHLELENRRQVPKVVKVIINVGLGDASQNAKLLEEALNHVGLYGFEDLPTSMLSAGQKRRVALAQLFLTRATLWILDEPYTSLDVTAVTLLEDLFRQHVQAGGLLIVTSHQALNIAGCVSKRLSLPEINIEQVA